MKERKGIVGCLIAAMVVVLLLGFSESVVVAQSAEMPSYPGLEERMKGNLPKIQDLTGGKVKAGDLIDKTNMDLVKDYLSEGAMECIRQGMVMPIRENPAPTEFEPKFFLEATEKNCKDAVMNEAGTVRMKDGSLWKGGVPFPEPETGLEVAANVKYGYVFDDMDQLGRLMFINGKGELEKYYRNAAMSLKVIGRLKTPPLGAIPGYEGELRRKVTAFKAPLEMAGVGQLTIRAYDEDKVPDAGFAYVPAFKRTIRQCASTWQQNLGGADLLWCDSEGIQDPFVGWNFKLLGKRMMLLPEFKEAVSPIPPDYRSSDKLNPEFKWDVGYRFPRFAYALCPTWIVEITPKADHPYSKKILYIAAYPYWPMFYQALQFECYDVSGKLWKNNIAPNGRIINKDGDNYSSTYGSITWDLQTGHSTIAMMDYIVNQGLGINELSLKTLVEWGR